MVYIYISNMQSINLKYVVFSSIQKKTNYRSKCVNCMPQILSDFVFLCSLLYNVFLNSCMFVVYIITSKYIFFQIFLKL
jgi:hypothetical protein